MSYGGRSSPGPAGEERERAEKRKKREGRTYLQKFSKSNEKMNVRLQ